VKQKLIYTAFLLYAFLCFGLALVEIYKYPGVVAKFTHIDLSYFIYLLVLLSVLVKKPEKHKKIFIVGSAIIILFFVGTTLIESMTYNNFVFSQFHINLGGVPNLASIFFIILAPYYLQNKKLLDKIALVILGVWAIPNILNTFSYASDKIAFQLRYTNATYDEKMRTNWDGFYDCMKLIKTNTPENSTIFIPPQADVWQMEGNEYLVRYFLYPRNIIHFGNIIESKKYPSPKFAIYSWGYWYTGDRKNGAWPYEKFPTREAIFLDSKDNINSDKAVTFDKEKMVDKETCGIVNLESL
jgi:hypothetical protein